MSTHAAQRPRAAASAGWLPLMCVLASIVLVAGSAITWITSPNWGHHQVTAVARNIGTIPAMPGALTVPLVSPDMIEIPKLQQKAPIVRVSTLPDGALDVPLNPKIVGWWSGGAKPGARVGTAILAGHINYAGVAGALGQINTLDPGDRVFIDGISAGKKSRVAFKITGVRTYNKNALPYKEIFDQKSVGRVAIVTCGGPFDARTGNYLDNIVAFAVPV